MNIYRVPLGNLYMRNRPEYHSKLLNIIREFNKDSVLDIGERNPFTERMENEFNIKIDSTTSDLDYSIDMDRNKTTPYALIVCSHVIEHIMNPLLLLNNIKALMSLKSILMVAYPISIIKSKYHFHEILIRDFKILIDKAGFRIENWIKLRVKLNLYGVRPILRSIFDRNHIIILKLRS